jgi:conjugative relaxase-like TrwC/TraI family protein
MLSVRRINSAQASSYYTADDYYLQDNSIGQWYGETGKSLGYTGTIKEADFQKLILGQDNRENPRFQIQAGGKDHKHSAGIDFTFSAPKSVSIAALILDDKRIFKAQEDAVNKALEYSQKHYTNVRVKENNQVRSEYTGNLLAAKFQHVSSREVDPHLHDHCVVLNITINEDRKVRAMDYKGMTDNIILLGQVYRSELAANLKGLGYQIETDSRGLFELKGMPQKVIDEFSKRTQQIEQRYQELKEQFPNRDYTELRQQATLETRKVKDEPSIVELKKDWERQLNELGLTKDQLMNNLKSQKELPTQSKDEIIVKAVQIATEHEAVAKEEDIIRVAAKLGMGNYRVDELKTALSESKDIIHLQNNAYTTFEIVEMERGIINQAVSGHNQLQGMKLTTARAGIMDYEINKGFKLTDGQREAVMHVLGSNDRILAIQGDAGTGKTTMLDVVRTISESQQSQEVVGLSFTGKAASEIESASKINSRTIASLLASQDDLKGKLVVIDEASMVSIKDMNALLKRCDEQTKIVLIGDTKQLQTLGQGEIFASLQKHEAVKTVRISEIQRQKDADYKDVVVKLGEKNVAEAFNKLERMGAIREVTDRDKRLTEITNKYLENPKETIIVTATNKDREQLNQMIRNELRNSGKLDQTVKPYVTREVKTIYGEEKFFNENYEKNEIIVTNSASVLGKAGAEARIIGVNRDKNTITVDDGTRKHDIDLKEHGNELQVYKQTIREFTEGDKILFLKNDKGLGVKNGQTAFITGIDEKGTLQVKMENGREFQFNPGTQYKYITHGYALTDYKSQGQTEKHVIYHADTSKGINYNQAYVGITRGKESVSIYTDSTNQLKELAGVEQVKTSTLNYDLNQAKSALAERLAAIDAKVPKLSEDRLLGKNQEFDNNSKRTNDQEQTKDMNRSKNNDLVR